MQNWDSLQPANYDFNWYSNMFSVKNEPSSVTVTTPPNTTIDQQNYFNSMKQTNSVAAMAAAAAIADLNSPSSSPSKTTDCHQETTNYLDSNCNGVMLNNHHSSSYPHHHPLGFNPLTPPGLPNAILPSINFQSTTNHQSNQNRSPSLDIDKKPPEDNSLTPRNTPPVDVTPPKSPKGPVNNIGSEITNNSFDNTKDDIISNSSEDTRFLESEDEASIRVPIYNSHGKMKNYKCKNCGFLAITKVAFWNHSREHMKPEKMLQCPKCPFVTELKHHLEYHIRKHKNLKPFQCDKCSYSCVNKSMLNSHLKSHSSVYQFRCSDCDYATKYCHSFKLHLRKYKHEPGIVLDDEGKPNPSVVIDVYGTRRGPKMKSGTKSSRSSKSSSMRGNGISGLAEIKKEIDFDAQSLFPLCNDKNNLSPPMVVINNNNNNNNKALQSSKLHHSAPNKNNVNSVMSNLLSNDLASMLHQTRNSMSSFLPYFNLNLQMIAAQQHAAAWSHPIPPQLAQNTFRMKNESNVDDDDDDDYDEDENDLISNVTVEIKDHEEKISKEFLSKGARKFEFGELEAKQICNSGRKQNGAMDLSAQTTSFVKPNELIPKNSNDIMDDQNITLITSTSLKHKTQLHKIDSDIEMIDTSKKYEIETKPNSMDHDGLSETFQNENNQNVNITAKNEKENKENGSLKAVPKTEEVPTSSSQELTEDQPIKKDLPTTSTIECNQSQTSQITSQIPGIFECKYCDIYFKDAVLYTIHMGYHSCDDVFKCNMCGEKCDGPVGLFIHMARNAHS